MRGSRADRGGHPALRILGAAAAVAALTSLPLPWPLLHRAVEAVLHLP